MGRHTAKYSEARTLIGRIFPGHAIEIDEYDHAEHSLTFTVQGYGAPVNYETLLKVSETLGTKDISIEGGEVSTGWCETCAGSEPKITIYVKNITKELP